MARVTLQGVYVGDDQIRKELKADVSSELIIISHTHSKVHEGKFFKASKFAAGVADTGTITLLLETGTKTVHTYITAASTGDATLDITEGVTATAGTAITIQNYNCTSTNTPESIVSHTPTGVSGGTAFDGKELIPGGKNTGSGGSGQFGTEQAVFAPNTKYLITMTNIAGNAQTMSLSLSFYEV
jgi:hypothetical protein